MNIADYLLGGASGINRSALKFADTVAGNPVAGLANALGADIDYNPLTRAAQSVGVGRDAINDNQAIAQALMGSVGDMAAGAVPLAGDVAGLRDDATAVQESGYHPAMIGLALAGAIPFVPSLIRALPDSVTDRFKSRSDLFGGREVGAIGDVGRVKPEDYRTSATLDDAGAPIVKEGRTFSQRRPTAAGREREYLDNHLDLDFGEWASSSAGLAAAEKLPDNQFLNIDPRLNPRGRLDQAVDQMGPRLNSFVDRADPQLVEEASEWYPAFNNLGNQLSVLHGVPTENGAAAYAALSPSTKWNANLEHGQRLSHILRTQGDLPIDGDIRRKMTEGDFAERFIKGRSKQEALQELLKAKYANDVFGNGDPLQSAMLTAAIDDLYYPKTRGDWSPRGQLLGEEMTQANNPAIYVPNSIGANANSIMALQGGYDEASEALGKAHKVRTFATNGAAPSFPGAFTADTHAMGAALGAPLGSGHPLIQQGFGTKHASGLNPNATGYSGMYPLYHEVYNRAAKDAVGRGLLPRESAMQSVPWEVKRQMFSSTPSSLKASEAIWGDFRSGKISNDQAIDRLWSELAK